MVEAGNPSGASLTQFTRKWLLHRFGSSSSKRGDTGDTPEGGVEIVAPCTHQRPCPMAGGVSEWCHFAQPYLQSHMQRFISAAIPKYSSPVRGTGPKTPGGGKHVAIEKFSYLVALKTLGKDTAVERCSPVAAHLLSPKSRHAIRGDSEGDHLSGIGGEGGGAGGIARIVATPKKRGGHVIFRLCGSCGYDDDSLPSSYGSSVESTVVSKSDPNYAELKGKQWGDLLFRADGEQGLTG